MTDELYDYFGGSASRKVEPIEDDDLDVNESVAETTEESPVAEDVDVVAEEAREENAVAASTEAESPTEPPKTTEPEPKPKKSGHWDFLANMLGIGGRDSSPAADVPETPAPEAVVEETEEEVVQAAGAPSTDESFLGLDNIPSPEDKTVLPEMFTSEEETESPSTEPEASSNESTNDDLIGWAPAPSKFKPVKKEPAPEPKPAAQKKAAEVAEPDADGEEFVEFEIEELDSSPRSKDEDSRAGRSPRRRRSSRRSEEQEEERPRRRKRRTRAEDRDDEVSEEPVEAFEPDEEESVPVEKKKKRRRRRRKPAVESSDNLEDEFDAEEAPVSYDEEDTPERARDDARRSSGRGRRRSKSRSEESTGRDEPERKRAKVPTWDEAISGMIESNIKNHKKSSGRGNNRKSGGNGNRGRGRR